MASGTGAAHKNTLRALAAPGAWWSGPERVAIIGEAREAPGCSICNRRARSSFATIGGIEHDGRNGLPPEAVEAIHGMRNDSGHLTRRWFEHVIAAGMRPEAYVELVAVVASSVVVDTFAQGVGFGLPDLGLNAFAPPEKW